MLALGDGVMDPTAYFLHFLVHSVFLPRQRPCNGGQIQTSGGFDSKPDAKSAIHVVDATGKSLNIHNLSNTNIAYLDN
jgi:hypothetical protein